MVTLTDLKEALSDIIGVLVDFRSGGIAREAFRETFIRKVFLGYNPEDYPYLYDCKYNPFTEEYYVTGFQSTKLFRVKPQEGWSVEEVAVGNALEMLAIDSAGKVWFTPTQGTPGGAYNLYVSKYNPDTGVISTYDMSGVPNFVRGAGIAYDARRDKILVCGHQVLVELNMDGTVNRTLATTVDILEGILIQGDLAYLTTVGTPGSASLVIVNLTTFTEIGATNIATSLGAPYLVTHGGEKFSYHFSLDMPMLVMHVHLWVSAIRVRCTMILLLAADGKSVREAAIVSNGSSYIQRLPENLASVGTGILNYLTGDFKSLPNIGTGVDWDGENIIYAHSGPVSPYASYFNVEKPELTGRFRTTIPLWSDESIAAGGVASPAIWTQWCEQITFNFLSADEPGDFDIEYWDEQADAWRKYDEDIVVVAGTPNIYPAGGGKKMMRLWTNLDGVSDCDLEVHLR